MLSTARVQRGPSEAARCASKESVPVAPAYGPLLNPTIDTAAHLSRVVKQGKP
jgi:hypothetical protein